MSEVSDWALVAFTAALVGATIVLVKATLRLAKVTKEVGETAENLKIMPDLVFERAQSLRDAGDKFVRIGLRNIGRGPAKNLVMVAFDGSGREFDVLTNSLGSVVEESNIFWWDIYGPKVGDNTKIEVTYTDLKGKKMTPYTHPFTA